MKNRILHLFLILIFALSACGGEQPPVSSSPAPDSTATRIPLTETFTPIPTLTATSTPAPTETPTQTPIPTVESLKAKVTAEKLSCRYGPGALYLYLYALNQTANIKLIGRTDANDWVWVDGTNKCWVHSKFLEIDGDAKQLPIVYPGLKLPVSYQPSTFCLGTFQQNNQR